MGDGVRARPRGSLVGYVLRPEMIVIVGVRATSLTEFVENT
jgi:hypothetical protein